MKIVLASQSPARLATLRAAGIKPEVVVSGVDESQIVSRDPANLASALAQLKCRAVAADRPDDLVIGCDSVLAFEGEILGKPGDAATATARWRRMRGRSGVLHTGHCLLPGVLPGRSEPRLAVVSTALDFAAVDRAEIEAYVASGEPLQCAGGFALEGRGGLLVERIEGCFSNVIGLSLPLLRRWLRCDRP